LEILEEVLEMNASRIWLQTVACDSDFESVEKLLCRIRINLLALKFQANATTARKVDFACENLNAMFETDPK